METNFNFKSQICTDKNQSERLLALGIKKETADMVHYKSASMKEWGILATPWRDDCEGCKCYSPAWSLHRLIEMVAGGSEEQMIFLPDPPYMISRDTNFSKGGGNEAKYGSLSMDFGEWDKGEAIDMEAFFKEAYRLLKNGGTIIMFYDIFKMETIKNIADKVGFKQPRIGFWNKTNAVPVNARINYLSNAREYFISFCKGKKGAFNSYYDKGVYDYPIVSGKERVHPTQKPYGLMRDLIATHTKEGDVVLDPFAGSGVVGRACKDMNRETILIEMDKKYYELIKQL